MRPRSWILALLTGLLAGCGGEGPGLPGTDNDVVAIGGGGFDEAGVEGFAGLNLPGGAFPEDTWAFLFGANTGNPDDCLGANGAAPPGQCGLGGVVSSWGTLTSPTLAFGVVTTNDFPDPFNTINTIPVVLSGISSPDLIVSTQDGQTWTRAALTLDLALLSARADPAAGGDQATILVGPESGPMTTVFTTRGSDLGGSLPLRPGGCGEQALPADESGLVTPMPTCSDWHHQEIDISQFLEQTVRIQIIVAEAGGGADPGLTLAFDNLEIEVSR
jgi:hypothetical protein